MSEKQNQQLAELRQRPHQELQTLLSESTVAYRRMCFKHAGTPSPKGHLLRQARRHIARLQTVLNQSPRADEEGA